MPFFFNLCKDADNLPDTGHRKLITEYFIMINTENRIFAGGGEGI